MSALKQQGAAASITATAASIRWPVLTIPDSPGRGGMTPEQIQALQAWYSALQGAVNTQFAALAQSSQLKSTGN